MFISMFLPPINKFSIHSLFKNQTLTTIYLIILCIQFVPLEGYGVSPLKVILMSLAPLFFIIKTPFISKALIWGLSYWGVCFFCALFAGDMRFSTLGFLGMYIISYILFYNLVHDGTFTLDFYINLIKYLIIAFGFFLIAQQVCMVIGLKNFPPFNLANQHFLSLTKLPSLTIEPSHTARILTAAMLGYLRCWEIKAEGKLTIMNLFAKEHKLVALMFLWIMLTQGSGTGFIGLGILCLYFITRQTAIYIIPILITLFSLGTFFEIEQLQRPVNLIETTVSSKGDIRKIQDTDGSGATRIIPIVNTITKTDLTKSETWFGEGTTSLKERKNWFRNVDTKIGVIEQYGLIAFLISMILVYSCMIKRILSLETLIFVGLLGCSLSNIYYTWGCMMLFSVVRYFQEQEEKGLLDFDKDE